MNEFGIKKKTLLVITCVFTVFIFIVTAAIALKNDKIKFPTTSGGYNETDGASAESAEIAETSGAENSLTGCSGSDETDFVPYTTSNFFTVKTHAGTQYLLHEPAVVTEGKKYPVIVHLYGAGEESYIIRSVFDSIGGNLLSGLLYSINLDPDYYESYIIVPVTNGWGPSPYVLNGIIDAVMAQGQADADRLYITGTSMGGFATTDYVFEYPERVACAVPISGATCTSNLYSKILDVPIRIYHSKDDPTVSVSNSRTYYNSIVSIGGVNAEYFELDGFGHFPYSYVYNQTDMIEWMYRQRKDSGEHLTD